MGRRYKNGPKRLGPMLGYLEPFWATHVGIVPRRSFLPQASPFLPLQQVMAGLFLARRALSACRPPLFAAVRHFTLRLSKTAIESPRVCHPQSNCDAHLLRAYFSGKVSCLGKFNPHNPPKRAPCVYKNCAQKPRKKRFLPQLPRPHPLQAKRLRATPH